MNRRDPWRWLALGEMHASRGAHRGLPDPPTHYPLVQEAGAPNGRRYPRSRRCRLDLAFLVGLDHIAFMKILEVRETNPTLEAGRDLTDIVLVPAK